MNTKTKIISIVVLVILAAAALGAGSAFAQTPTPTSYGPGWMMGGNYQAGTGYGMMGGRGGMHTFVLDALDEKLGLTSDELYAEVKSGKTIAQIGEENGVSRADLLAALETAHKDSLAQAVVDGSLTQEQADSILSEMVDRYEWMLDNAGFQNMGGRGGMMGGAYGPQGANGEYGPGACHGNWDNGSQP